MNRKYIIPVIVILLAISLFLIPEYVKAKSESSIQDTNTAPAVPKGKGGSGKGGGKGGGKGKGKGGAVPPVSSIPDINNISSKTKDVNTGEIVYAWLGNCGIQVLSQSFTGTVELNMGTINAPGSYDYSSCQIAFYDSKGKETDKRPEAYYVFIILKEHTLRSWENGDIKFYVHENNNWKTCDPNYIHLMANEGTHGILRCLTNGDAFGLGK